MSGYEMILAETHGRVGLIRLNRPAALNAVCAHLVAELAKRADDAVLGLPAMHLVGSLPLERIGRHQRRVHEHQDAQRFLHSATQLRRL